MMLDINNVLSLKVLILREICDYVICECCILGLLRVPDSCKFLFPSVGHDSWVWVMIKLVSERLGLVSYDLG